MTYAAMNGTATADDYAMHWIGVLHGVCLDRTDDSIWLSLL